MKVICEATTKLCNEGPRKVGMVRSEEGRLLTKVRWQEYFIEVSDRPVPEVTAELDEINVVNDSIDIGEITWEEIKIALEDIP